MIDGGALQPRLDQVGRAVQVEELSAVVPALWVPEVCNRAGPPA